jgi:2-hydroxychromene-2-carboxylate isomerase
MNLRHRSSHAPRRKAQNCHDAEYSQEDRDHECLTRCCAFEQRGAVHVEFWFDFSCPYAYLASAKIAALCQQRNATLEFQPMLLGGVFRAIGAGAGPMATIMPAKAQHLHADLHRWSELLQVPLTIPASHPMRTVLALRTLLSLPKADWSRAISAIYAAYWQRGVDITDRGPLLRVLTDAGIDHAHAQRAIDLSDDDEVKADLHARTDAAVAHGIFGAPAMRVFVDDNPPLLLWGQDRLQWVEAALDGWRPDHDVRRRTQQPATSHVGNAASVDFYFDVASPYAYFALQQLQDFQNRCNTKIRLRPILLGALFRNIGQVDVPLFGFSDNKRRYLMNEMQRWARWLNVAFSFPSRFPQRTVTAQRLILLSEAIASDRAAMLALRLAQIFWAEAGNLDDDATLTGALIECGLPSSLLATTQLPQAKQALIDATASAQAAGVFGVPAWVLTDAGSGQTSELFWGQDRMILVETAIGQPRNTR